MLGKELRRGVVTMVAVILVLAVLGSQAYASGPTINSVRIEGLTIVQERYVQATDLHQNFRIRVDYASQRPFRTFFYELIWIQKGGLEFYGKLVDKSVWPFQTDVSHLRITTGFSVKSVDAQELVPHGWTRATKILLRVWGADADGRKSNTREREYLVVQ